MESKDLGLLLTLDALLQEENVTRAARRLGLSTPAASHALARIREKLGDPILVRAGRKMVLTPRAERLRPRVRTLVEEAARVLKPERPFAVDTLERELTVFATDQFLMVVGTTVDRIVREEAPRVSLRFLPSTVEDWVPLREGAGDMAICLPGHFPGEFRTRQLFLDRFVCVVRKEHPIVGQRLTLDTSLDLEHVVVSPLGAPSAVDRTLEARGLTRTIRRTVPYFHSALLLVASTDYALTVSIHAVLATRGTLSLHMMEPPLPLSPYALNLLWHPRLDNEPANQWLRDVFVRAVRETMPELPGPVGR